VTTSVASPIVHAPVSAQSTYQIAQQQFDRIARGWV